MIVRWRIEEKMEKMSWWKPAIILVERQRRIRIRYGDNRALSLLDRNLIQYTARNDRARAKLDEKMSSRVPTGSKLTRTHASRRRRCGGMTNAYGAWGVAWVVSGLEYVVFFNAYSKNTLPIFILISTSMSASSLFQKINLEYFA